MLSESKQSFALGLLGLSALGGLTISPPADPSVDSPPAVVRNVEAIDELSDQYELKIDSLVDKDRSSQSEVRKKMLELRDEAKRLGSRAESLSKRAADHEQHTEQINHNAIHLDKDLEGLKEQLVKEKEEVKKLEASVNKLRSSINTSQNSNRSFSKDIAKLEAELRRDKARAHHKAREVGEWTKARGLFRRWVTEIREKRFKEKQLEERRRQRWDER